TWARQLRDEALVGYIDRMPGVVREPLDASAEAASDRPRLSYADAAACTLEACEVLAGLHAGGFSGDRHDPISFAPEHLRVVAHGPEWHIAWQLPGYARPGPLPPMTDADIDDIFADGDEDGSPIVRDLRGLYGLFTDLCDGAATPDDRVQVAALATLAQFGQRVGGASPFVSVGLLAQLLAPLAPPRSTARARGIRFVNDLPPVRLDWDAVIAEGEAILADPSRPRYLMWRGRDLAVDGWIELPLAAAYHQRASRAFAQADLAPALRDSERAAALDDHAPYHTTRAIVLDALGRTAESRAAIALATSGARSPGPSAQELARFLATRGLFALHDGAGDHGLADLRRACELHPAATYFHGLAAALAAAGDSEAAVAAERRAVVVARGPDETHHRWALVARLYALGRVDEARAQAETAVRQWPRQHGRFLRYFGEPPTWREEDDFPFHD
ncbi:MAG TPA: hypothetical protein VGB85_32020, partial [Nannocystis sp.]